MTDIIARTIVELARLALYAYAVHHFRAVIIHWLDVTPAALTHEQIIDAARRRGLNVPMRRKVAA